MDDPNHDINWQASVVVATALRHTKPHLRGDLISALLLSVGAGLVVQFGPSEACQQVYRLADDLAARVN